MNRLAVSISILSVMAVGCGASVFATDRLTAEMSKQIEAVEYAFENNDKGTCVYAAEKLDKLWDDMMKYGILIPDLGHAVEITSSVAEINSFAREMNEELYTSCDRAQAQIKMFRDMQIPTLWKIL